MATRQQVAEDRLSTARFVAEATCLLLRGASLPSDALPGVIHALQEIASGKPGPRHVPLASILPSVISTIHDAENPAPRQPAPRRWTPVAPTTPPVTRVQKLEAALRRSPLRLDDRAAMAVAKASGKPIGRDKLEHVVEAGAGHLILTFGFDYGSAKFSAQVDPREAAGAAAVMALLEMLDARG